MEDSPQAHDSMKCRCAADIYSMKAMAARPAAPKEATSLTPAPVNGLTGLDGVAEADGTAHELQVEAEELLELELELELLEELAELVVEAQSAQPEVVVEVAGLVVVEVAGLVEAVVEAQSDQAEVVVALVVLLVLVVVVDLVVEAVVEAQSDQAEVVVDLVVLLVLVVLGVVDAVVVLVVVVMLVVVEEEDQPFQPSWATGPAAARPTRAATATNDFILIDWFGLVLMFSLNE
ncbi:unnamed protein product [Camellia sinensis]